MKVIDLLNKIAKGEEVPKRISINGGIHGIDVLEYDENCKDYINSSNIMLLYSGMTSNHLTDEVKNLEEAEDKEYEDIEELDGSIGYINWNSEAVVLTNAINTLIRNQKYILGVLNDKIN